MVNDQIGYTTYAADIAETILSIIAKTSSADIKWQPGIYNFTNDGIISWYEFAEAIKELIKCPCDVKPISTSEYPTAAKRPAYSVLDKTKIQETFGVRLKDWKKRLAICIDKISSNH